MAQPQAVQAVPVAPWKLLSVHFLLQHDLLWSLHFAPVSLEGLQILFFSEEEPKGPGDGASKRGSPLRVASKVKQELK